MQFSEKTDLEELADNIRNYLESLEHSEIEHLLAALISGHGVPYKARGLGIMAADVDFYLRTGYINPNQMEIIKK